MEPIAKHPKTTARPSYLIATCHIISLPSELQLIVLGYLPLRGRIAVIPYVCRRWHALAPLSITSIPQYPPQSLRKALARWKSISSLNLIGMSANTELFIAIRSLPNLTELSIHGHLIQVWTAMLPQMLSTRLCRLDVHGKLVASIAPLINANADTLRSLSLSGVDAATLHGLMQIKIPCLTSLVLFFIAEFIDQHLFSLFLTRFSSVRHLELRTTGPILSIRDDVTLPRLESLKLREAGDPDRWLKRVPTIRALALDFGGKLSDPVSSLLTSACGPPDQLRPTHVTQLQELYIKSSCQQNFSLVAPLASKLRLLRMLHFPWQEFQANRECFLHLESISAGISPKEARLVDPSKSFTQLAHLHLHLSQDDGASPAYSEYVELQMVLLRGFPRLQVFGIKANDDVQCQANLLLPLLLMAEAQGLEVYRDTTVTSGFPDVQRHLKWLQISHVERECCRWISLR